MKIRIARLLLACGLLVAVMNSLPAASAAPDDLCPTIGGNQPVDICVPPSKPRAWITAICVNQEHGKVRIRLKNNGDFMTETFWIIGGGADRLIHVRPGEAKTRWIKRLTPGETVSVVAHGLEYAYAQVRERNCR